MNTEIIPWDPWEELGKLKAHTDRLWDAFLARLAQQDLGDTKIAFLPDADFVETASQYRLYVAIPGLVEEDIDIGMEGKTLTVRGERQPFYDPEHAQCRIGEWRYGYFERRFQMPRPIPSHRLRATYESGVLSIVVSKSELD